MYVKLFASILDSSLWEEDHATIRLWITVLALADEHGIVSTVPTALARRARVTAEEFERAMAVLIAPDPESRTPDHDGRRVEKVQGGYLVLNHAKYREIRTRAQQAAAERQARHRDKSRNEVGDDAEGVTSHTRHAPVTPVTTNASASAPHSVVEVPEKKKNEHPDFDERPFVVFNENAPIVIDLIRSSHKQAAVAASIWKHTLGSYNAGMGGAIVAHAQLIGVAVQAYVANMKPDDVFVDRLFEGYVKDTVRSAGAGEQRARAKREDSHVDRERSEEEQRQREEAAIIRKIEDFKRENPDAFAAYQTQADRAVLPQIKGIFRAPTVRAKLVELIDKHGAA